VPLATPWQSVAGLRTLTRNFFALGAPTIAGAMIGVACCGDLQELLNLTRNSSIYKKEFKAIHRELYTYN
jgi:hypothetical protein